MGLPANSSSQPTSEPGSSQGSSKKKDKEKFKKGKKNLRTAGGQKWEDLTLEEWPKDDFRLFAGDLGNDVSDDVLVRTFNKYPSFLRAKVVRDRKTNKSKGYGFISFKDPQDFARAQRDMNGTYHISSYFHIIIFSQSSYITYKYESSYFQPFSFHSLPFCSSILYNRFSSYPFFEQV